MQKPKFQLCMVSPDGDIQLMTVYSWDELTKTVHNSLVPVFSIHIAFNGYVDPLKEKEQTEEVKNEE